MLHEKRKNVFYIYNCVAGCFIDNLPANRIILVVVMPRPRKRKGLDNTVVNI